MLDVFKEFTFEAAHRIPPYSSLHGHSFVVEVLVRGEPDAEFGWAMTLTRIEPCIQVVQKALDHKYLNDIVGLEVPSLENVARWIWRQLGPELSGLHRITVRRGLSGQMEGCVLRAPVAG
jgi:6-pyruvoyltetrahydropterin/6-carboxytetrahydropterin synthase